MRKKVVLIDDDELFRAGLTRLIDSFDNFEVELNMSSTEFMDLVVEPRQKEGYNLVILSPPGPASHGIKYCEKSVKYFSPSPVMVFSNLITKYSVMKALECGVSAYYTKWISPFDLEDVMIELTARKNFSDIKMEPRVRNVLIHEEDLSVSFTEAETEVLRLVCEQKSSAEISTDLGISVRTVESRKRNMMLKTNSKNMIGVVMIFMRSDQFEQGERRAPGT